MALYSPQIESQIAQALRLRGRVAPDSIPGLTDEEGAAFLARFADDHPGQVAYEGADLVPVAPLGSVAPVPVTPGPDDAAPKLSPVDQVLASGPGTSLLDTRPSQGKVAGWLWILPLTFLLPGGIIAWFIAKDQNRAVARTMLIVSAALTVLTVVTAPAIGPMMGALSGGVAPGAQSGVGLPASSTGEPAFYYFGTAT